MTRKPSQEDITLRMLREAGSRGLHTFEMRQAYIANPSQRIANLEARGHQIRRGERERLNGAAMGRRYFLTFDVERGAGTPESPAPFGLGEVALPASAPFDTGSLFDREPAVRPRLWDVA